MTMIARVADGLPLAASVQEEEQVCVDLAWNPALYFAYSSYNAGDSAVQIMRGICSAKLSSSKDETS